MHTLLTTAVIDTECPETMTEQNCPLRSWLNTQKLFNVKNNELCPTEPLFRLARAPYVYAINKMNQICRDCINKQK